MKKFLYLCIPVVTLFVQCAESEKDTLFRLVSTSDSNLEFRNDLFEDDATNVINLEYFYNGGGVVAADFNNDGLNDLFFTGNMVANKLYLNEGDLSFRDVTGEAKVEGLSRWKSGAAVADINGDGLLDIYVCATIALDSANRRNMMFINQGISKDGIPTFIDKAEEMGITVQGFSSNAGFLDYDGDGDMDLFVIQNSRQRGPVNYRPKVNDGTSINTDKLYRNNGDGSFTDVSREAGILKEGYSLGLAFLDVNKDGHTDIYICNDYITNDILYVNDGRGRFTDQIDSYIKHQSKFAMGSDVADINNDGNLDIITVDMLPDNNLRKKTVISGSGYITYINDERYKYTHQYVRNMLQLNNGDGTFSEIGQLAGVYQTEWSWSPLFADFDNDGYRDLIITNGFPKDITDRDFIAFREETIGIASVKHLLNEMPSVKVPNFAFRNTGNLVFEDVTNEWGFSQPSFSNGAAYADLDNDGDLDYVVNNVNDYASLYENRLYTGRKEEKPVNHYLRLKLKGPEGNLLGVGAKISLKDNGKLQYAEHSISRGYISVVESTVHFGLGADESVDTVLIEWPDGKVNIQTKVRADQVLLVDYTTATDKPANVNEPSALSQVVTSLDNSGLEVRHQEESQIDFNIQRTLPRKYSQRGPALAVGDINNDGLDDVVMGGGSGFSARIFIQGKNNTFKMNAGPVKKGRQEDAGLLLFDADNDGDQDLYCVSGAYEFPAGDPNQQDFLYLNDGKGNYTVAAGNLPAIRSSGSCVRANDFDKDGDLDLFVGGAVSYNQYPLADSSYLLINDKGRFTDETSSLFRELHTLGIVNDAIWSDYDNDGNTDLIIVGEFLPVTILRNTGTKFERATATGLDAYAGWYNSIAGGDFDNDGDTDYLVGNLGLNQYYNVSMTQPLSICAKDFDGNGSMDAVLSCFIKAPEGGMKQYPIHFWDELNSQSPKFRKKFAKFKEFGATPTDKFFTADELKGAYVMNATFMESAYLINEGGKFKVVSLPMIAQVGPVNGIVVEDFDLDGNLDAFLVGNDYGNEPTFGQYDAFSGLVLKGKGDNSFEVLQAKNTGFDVNGDAKALVRIFGNNRLLFAASQNQDTTRTYALALGEQTVFSPKPMDSHAIVSYKNGRKQKVEFYYGVGYLSQPSRRMRIPGTADQVEIFDSKGQSRTIVPNKMVK